MANLRAGLTPWFRQRRTRGSASARYVKCWRGLAVSKAQLDITLATI